MANGAAEFLGKTEERTALKEAERAARSVDWVQSDIPTTARGKWDRRKRERDEEAQEDGGCVVKLRWREPVDSGLGMNLSV